ncbi:DUF6153 family protein [Streptomyces sp. NPDC093094]|uniref:DUF6153 family protein n=1 Tax=Streptomyces sp. NPDC093094 TaxID=3366026 RepID=UPI00381E82D3
MTAPTPLRRAVPPNRWSVLLAWGLLVGLLGMHGLAPGGTASVSGHHPAMAAAQDGTAMRPDRDAESVCHGDGGGHLHHADATCASGAVGAGPSLDPPLPGPADRAAAPYAGRPAATGGPEGGRSPPSLAELQLLRI